MDSKSKKRVLLINPPFYRLMNSHFNGLSLGLSYIAAVLSEKRYEVGIYNADYQSGGEYADLRKIFEEYDNYKKILSTHFNPDIIGNLRRFSTQGFRCVKCNTKYRRPPLTNAGKCLSCGGKIILTVNPGGIRKYIPRALELCKQFNLDDYTIQRMELIEEYVESLTNNPKIKQHQLVDFF